MLRLRAGITLSAALGLLVWSPRDAQACGGCFHAPPPPSMTATVVTDHRMIFSVSPAQTTLYDQIRYQGSPSDFAWVLPIKGTVTVGTSSDILFETLEQATRTTIVAPPLPPCPPPPACPCCGSCGGEDGGEADAGASPFASGMVPVTVLSESVVGPYEQVQLRSTDPTALETWLSTHGYVIPTTVQPVVAAYVSDGFDFLAIRLLPGQGVQSMRPIRVTTPGAGLTLPLRMVAAGTGPTVGITLWVIGSGRYEPVNFQTFAIAASEITWDFSTNSSDYATLRANKEAQLGHSAWQTESSVDLDPYQIESPVLADPAARDYLPPSEAGDGGGTDASPDASLGPVDARTQDLAACFPSAAPVRITRLRADLSQAALAQDIVLQASLDQGQMSNVYEATKSVHAPACPTYPPCPVCQHDGINSLVGCSAAAGGEPRGAGLELVLLCVVAVSALRSRSARRGQGRPPNHPGSAKKK